LGDALASVFGVIGTLSALLSARATNVGQEVDVAIYEAVAALMESTMADYELGGVVRTRSGSVLPGVSPSNVYATSDGAEVVIAANADGVFVRLCKAMRRPELADDARFASHAARGTHMDTLDHIIRNRTEYTEDFRKDYFGWHIHYHLGSDEKRGLAKFVELLRKHGLGPVHDPKFVT
jgi:formyl-CoA transferase/succinyl-CoA--D-citramalate CoA-transferase